jgi:magnesium transporter
MSRLPGRLRPHPVLHGSQAGSAPGVLRPPPGAKPTEVRWMRYDAKECQEGASEDFQALAACRAEGFVVWVDVCGMENVEAIGRLAQAFALHPLAMEDAVSHHQRSKVEVYPDHLFIVARMAEPNDAEASEQLSLLVGKGYVIALQEKPGDPLEPVRERLRNARGRIRERGADYLAYALLDATVDAWFPHVEHLDAEMEALEDVVLAHDRSHNVIEVLTGVRHRAARLRRMLQGLRDAVEDLLVALDAFGTKENSKEVKETKVHVRDVLDHLKRMLETVDANRELTISLMDYQITWSNQQMNEVMKLLTVMSTLFIPLTFMAGIWGMNFEHMPELAQTYGYPMALGLMATIAGGLFWWFRRKGWIGKVPALGSHRHRQKRKALWP